MKHIGTALLVVVIALLALFVSSPAMAEAWQPDASQVTPIPITDPSGYPPLEEAFAAEGWVYEDPTLRVEITTDRYCNTPMFITRIQTAHPSQLRTMLAGSYRSKRTALGTTLAQRGNAVLAVNGDYYSYSHSGVILRQGELMRYVPDENCDVLLIDDAGDFHIVLNAGEEALSLAFSELGGPVLEGGRIMQGLTFGPALIVNGQQAHDVLSRSDSKPEQRAQRMVIAQDGPMSYLVFTCEGPDNADSTGLTLQEMADYVQQYGGVQNAYNLDGGGSSMVIFHYKKVNALSTSKNRDISDILYFSTGIAPEGD